MMERFSTFFKKRYIKGYKQNDGNGLKTEVREEDPNGFDSPAGRQSHWRCQRD